MRTEAPCNESRFFPVRIDIQGVPCKPYRVWVCSEVFKGIFGSTISSIFYWVSLVRFFALQSLFFCKKLRFLYILQDFLFGFWEMVIMCP